jgi:hypothetical protein
LGSLYSPDSKIIEREVTITSKRSRGELVPQADESSSGDDVEVLEAPRGESYCLHFTYN